MSAMIRKFRSQKGDDEPQSTSAGLAKADQPAPTATLGLRVVNPRQVEAVIE